MTLPEYLANVSCALFAADVGVSRHTATKWTGGEPAAKRYWRRIQDATDGKVGLVELELALMHVRVAEGGVALKGVFRGLNPWDVRQVQDLMAHASAEFDRHAAVRPELRQPIASGGHVKWPGFRDHALGDYSAITYKHAVAMYRYARKQYGGEVGRARALVSIAFYSCNVTTLRRFHNIPKQRYRLHELLHDSFGGDDGNVQWDAVEATLAMLDEYLRLASRVNQGHQVYPQSAGALTLQSACELASYGKRRGIAHSVLLERAVERLKERKLWAPDREPLSVTRLFMVALDVCEQAELRPEDLPPRNRPWAELITTLGLRPDVHIDTDKARGYPHGWVAAGFTLNATHVAEGGTMRDVESIAGKTYVALHGTARRTYKARYAFSWRKGILCLAITPETFQAARVYWDPMYRHFVEEPGWVPHLDAFRLFGYDKGLLYDDAGEPMSGAPPVRWGTRDERYVSESL
jgi:hypothetical protein